MKKTVYFLSLFLIIYSCSVNKEPVFIKVDNVKVLNFKSDTISIKADAFFENPNDVGGNISTENLSILVNDIEVAQVSAEEFKVPSRDQFTIPLTTKIPTKNLLNTNKNGVLGGLLNSLITKKVNIRIKGNLEYNLLGFTKEFLVDQTEEIKIKF